MSMIKLKYSMKGDKAVTKKLLALRKSGPEYFDAALYEMGMRIMVDSVDLVPVDAGFLKGSWFTAPPVTIGRGNSVVQIGYGKKYALAVHEILEAFHPHGQAKYLTEPFDAAMGTFLGSMTKLFNRNMKKGIKVKAVPVRVPTKPNPDES